MLLKRLILILALSKSYLFFSQEVLVGGIQMNEGDQQNWVNTIKEVGMNTVEVTVYAYQGRWNENNLWFYEHEAAVLEEIRYAKKAGLKVVLILRVQLDHAFQVNRFKWHGMIFPENQYFLTRWFEQYVRFTKKWAIISEQEGVDVFVIGSEMNALFATRPITDLPELETFYLSPSMQNSHIEKHIAFESKLSQDLLFTDGAPRYSNVREFVIDEIKSKEEWAKIVSFKDSTDRIKKINHRRAVMNWYWGDLIRQVREIYSGKITAAANFDNYQNVAFWDKLDFIGINAYFPLRSLEVNKSVDEQIKAGWDQILDEMLEFRKEAGVPNHPFLFTEIGYGNHEGSTLVPWQGSGFSILPTSGKDSLIIWKNQPVNRNERNLALMHLNKTVEAKNFPLAGLLYWKLTSKAEQLKYDPFALHIGEHTSDSLQSILLNFKY